MKMLIGLALSMMLVSFQVYAQAEEAQLNQLQSQLDGFQPTTAAEQASKTELQNDLNTLRGNFPNMTAEQRAQALRNMQSRLQSQYSSSGGEVAGAAGTTTRATNRASTATLIAIGVGLLAIIGAIIAGTTDNGTTGTTGTTGTHR